MKETLTRFGALLVISLLLIKISAFHVYEHFETLDGSSEGCEQCVFAVEGQDLKSFLPLVTVWNQLCSNTPAEQVTNYFSQILAIPFKEGLPFLRPPPHRSV